MSIEPHNLEANGLMLGAPPGALRETAHGIDGTLDFERPAYPFGHRLKNCSMGAFCFFNAAGQTSAYRVRFGRYAQIGESSIIGPPEHSQTGFSNHPFAFTRPALMPNMYALPDFAALAPDASAGPSYTDTVRNDTVLGHEVYLGAGSFVKRGVTISDGALIGARSVVTRDIPPYAIAFGSPARIVRLRFADKLVERLLTLQWWRYDLAPFKSALDFTQLEPTLEKLEQLLAEGQLQDLKPDTFRVTRTGPGGLSVVALPKPLFFS
ncbi:MAG: CatB-related O-acetyltransferase [Pseudomonadota bacterium]